jgi:DNA-binding transcriptional regulator PaaX
MTEEKKQRDAYYRYAAEHGLERVARMTYFDLRPRESWDTLWDQLQQMIEDPHVDIIRRACKNAR